MTGLIDETRMALGSLGDAASGLVHPTIRLGVTGLSRAGKTVFITALGAQFAAWRAAAAVFTHGNRTHRPGLSRAAAR